MSKMTPGSSQEVAKVGGSRPKATATAAILRVEEDFGGAYELVGDAGKARWP